ncbi:MAG: tetratricopeptide repeat protein [Thalassobaculaceae bacterium]
MSQVVAAAIARGDLSAAGGHLRAFLNRQPGHPALWEKLGVVELNRGQMAAARTAMRRTLLLHPTAAVAAINLFTLSDGAVSPANLLAILRRARCTVPGQPHVQYNHGKFRDLELGETMAAENDYRRTLLLAPAHPRALINIHRPLSKGEQWATSLLLARVAVRLMPGEPLAHQALAVALKGSDRLIEAKRAYQRSAALAPSPADIWYNFGNLAQTRGRDQRAIHLYRRAVMILPANASYHWNLALAQLLIGDFANGWASYEWRWRWTDFPSSPLPKVAPRWQGQMIAGRRLLVVSEQGLGDALQFVRYLAPLRAAGMHVGLICAAPIRRLFAAADIADEIFTQEASLPPFDWEIGLLSLPALLPDHGARPVDLSAAVPTPAPRRPGPLRVGLAWAGNPAHRRDAERSLSLDQLAPVLAVPDTAFIAIQHGPARAEIKRLGLRDRVDDWGDTVDLLAAAENIVDLDLVITIDSALAHLAASLGVPTWLLISEPPDWRWHRDSVDSRWYPSVRLYRQPSRKQWALAIKAVADDLFAIRLKSTL